MNTNKLFAGLLAAVLSAGALTAGAGAESVPMKITTEKYTSETIGDLFFMGASDLNDKGEVVDIDGELEVKCKYCDFNYNPEREGVKEVVIPSEVNGMKVTGLGFFGFQGCSNLKTITIPATVKRMHIDPFWGCNNLTDIYYGGSETDWNNITVLDVDYYSGKGSYGSHSSTWLNNATVHFNSGSAEEADSAKPSKVSSIKRAASKSTIKLTWNENEDADTYVVKYSTDKKTWKTRTVKTNSVTFKKLKSGTKYYFKIAAKKDGVTGDFSKVFSVTTKK